MLRPPLPLITAIVIVPNSVLGQVAAPTIAIRNVTIIDTRAGSASTARVANQSVVITGDRIVAVGPSGGVHVPGDATILDGTGKFLLPGLWDMHVHLNRATASQVRVMLPLMLANGITGVRDMLGDCWEPCGSRKTITDMGALQRQLEHGEVVGPRILALASPLVEGIRGQSRARATDPGFYRPNDAEEARALVAYLKSRGVDLIKVYNTVPREAFFPLMEEAHRLGIPVAGHLPWSVTPVEAAEAGMRSIEHARWPGLACNPRYEDFRAAFAEYASGRAEDFPAALFAEFRDAVVSSFDEERCAEIFRAFVEHDMYLVPTHLTREMDAKASDPVYRADRRRKYVPPARQRGWDRDLSNTANGPAVLLQFYRQFFELGLRVTGLAHRAGVKILAGTDAFDTMVFPGFSMHDELKHLVTAGLEPLEALRAATIRPAEFLDLTERYGTVAEGKAADLVLLDADPVADIANTKSIRAIIMQGRVHDRAALDAMIQGVEEYVRSLGS